MRKYRRVTLEDRCQLKAYLESNMTPAEIARRMSFHKSTISREIRRNSSRGRYISSLANQLAKARFEECRRKVRLSGPSLLLVLEKLETGWSPEQIAGRLKAERKLLTSHEAIYRLIRADKKNLGKMYRLLRRPVKQAQSRYYCRFKQTSKLQNIRSRDAIVARRERVGDWERDTIYGADRKYLLVLIDRKTKYLRLGRPLGRKASEIGSLTLELLRGKPMHTMTNDNGSEFKDHSPFPCPIYYCDPHRPQQRGTVENTVGLLRQYISRKTNLERMTDAEIKAIEDRLNNRPRKCLDYKTPSEVWSEELVALAS